MPASAPANVGYAALNAIFQRQLNPELLIVEADHDLRNSTDMILLKHIAQAVFSTDGIAQVQSISPGRSAPHWTTRRYRSRSARAARPGSNNLPFQQARGADLLEPVDVINNSIDVLRQQCASCDDGPAAPPTASQGIAADGRRRQRPARSGFANFEATSSVPCATTFIGSHTVSTSRPAPALRSLRHALDGMDALTDQLSSVFREHGTELDKLQPKLLAADSRLRWPDRRQTADLSR